MAFTDDKGSYAFNGVRKTDDDQYVLYFDAERKAFILDKVDSTFDMNVTRLPGNSDPDELSRQFPHLGIGSSSTTTKPSKPRAEKSKSKANPLLAAPKVQQKAKDVALALPQPNQTKSNPKTKKKKKVEDEDDDEEEEDDDGGLLIEYPGGAPAPKKADFSPAFPTQRRFDDYMDQRASEAEDADGESDDEPDMDFKLPSPVNKQDTPPAEPEAAEDDDMADLVADLEGDLEKEMEIALKDLANSQEETHDGDSSEISEED